MSTGCQRGKRRCNTVGLRLAAPQQHDRCGVQAATMRINHNVSIAKRIHKVLLRPRRPYAFCSRPAAHGFEAALLNEPMYPRCALQNIKDIHNYIAPSIYNDAAFITMSFPFRKVDYFHPRLLICGNDRIWISSLFRDHRSLLCLRRLSSSHDPHCGR